MRALHERVHVCMHAHVKTRKKSWRKKSPKPEIVAVVVAVAVSDTDEEVREARRGTQPKQGATLSTPAPDAP